MAIGMMLNGVGITQAQYEAVAAQMQRLAETLRALRGQRLTRPGGSAAPP